MKDLDRFIGSEKAAEVIRTLGNEFAIVTNPSYIHPSVEIYPLAAKIAEPLSQLDAVVMDMDGTTTTTEALCIHSLEYMVRRITGRMSISEWKGLDKREDYPHIIGNSTTNHVEYLISSYKDRIVDEKMRKSYLQSALWTLVHGKDSGRVADVTGNLNNLGSRKMIQDFPLEKLKQLSKDDEQQYHREIKYIIETWKDQIRIHSHTDRVRAAIDIYYQRYHEILDGIQKGKGQELAEKILGKSEKHLIEPMKGIGIFIALIKGWLGEELSNFTSALMETLPEGFDKNYIPNEHKLKVQLAKIGKHFEKNPAKISVVTSSILYEAEIVMSEVFRVLYSQIKDWPVSNSVKQIMLEKFSSYTNIYDGFVTATDSSEIRLKPHRDLYSIALHQLGIARADFGKVMGFEDSESGTIAIRAAGIGLCIAVPFSDTRHHNFRAASHILDGGLPEAILKHNVFLKI